MANLPISFSQTTCARFVGERSSETYLAAVAFYVFLLGNASFVLPSFSDDVS